MTTKIKVSDLGKMTGGLNVETLEGISIEGEIEINLESDGVNPQLGAVIGQESSQIATHLANLSNLLGRR
ncbi:CO dehydrogenase/acetyl-CoA synthase subunit delta, corrinoid iron-sulfur subcomplex small subunit [Methanosarcina siciliae C2J]|uniref:CO dehydrogenase/acetyl-CoA synthase subunit delta, corrinoid iron-sulfur subcomplex small subunit n=3 Tax=Methanosarcina siciliae TaxID=38027 RepID=A0A0E3LBF4_9EURY|nr:hypothetical protein [Methanosarcina siciliae]AKB29763.1 CO dehydrogenase/acetyl-CoA synthase subunit delta, corrinoid iron-sulfur subcomplex small subunit [Methanosarcina siciliae T4/M]AKB33676.1 CO dehydrogenase/acetyl-CoA synthase subunit delta, corrinoid iron-sulfur subcomplex small subunit [Methanosarcina siciliae HI350]AKB38048.1 CO dehydrogenase/acetyl-CoA synthase subunit delta, corrinoid iron-sulfur subcomplex small subunit [Methanosarcina siciliae C2J]